MKKTVLIIIGLLLTFISISQETEITLHDKGGYVSQTGKLVEGYKQGQWININRRGDTSFALYKKDQIIFEKTFVKQKILKFYHFKFTMMKQEMFTFTFYLKTLIKIRDKLLTLQEIKKMENTYKI